jgi:alpha-glucosidase
MANNDGGEAVINLDFLTPGAKYVAEIYSDGGDAVATRTHVKIESKRVKRGDKLRFNLLPRGGVAMRIVKE